MALFIDLTIIGIVVYCAWRGYRNGLIRGAFGTVALIASILIANIAANAYSSQFDGILIPFVGGRVDTTLSEIYSDELELEEVEHEDESPEFRSAYTAMRELGLPRPAAIKVAERAVADETDRTLSDVIADELSSSLTFVVVFAVAFALIAIVFAVIGNLIGFVFSLPGLRFIDIIAGAGFGFIKGIIIVLALAAVVRYLGVFARELLEETAILNSLVNNNFIADMLGI